jgi:hypothetical protein
MYVYIYVQFIHAYIDTHLIPIFGFMSPLLLLLLPLARTQMEKQIISKLHFGERSMHTYIEKFN